MTAELLLLVFSSAELPLLFLGLTSQLHARRVVWSTVLVPALLKVQENCCGGPRGEMDELSGSARCDRIPWQDVGA